MGELTGTFTKADSPEVTMQKDRASATDTSGGDTSKDIADKEIKGYKTDVDGVFCDALNKRDNLPVFKVGHKDFFQNMNYGRKRMRFSSGSNVQKYMQGSKYKGSFWIQHEKDGYMRKVK